VSLHKLVKALPCHVMACLLARQPACPPDAATAALTAAPLTATSCFDHVARALQLLANLSHLCVPTPQQRGDGLVGPDAAFTAQLVDAVNLVLLSVAGPEAETALRSAGAPGGAQPALDRASMVPAALRALALVASAHAPDPPPPGAEGGLHWGAVAEALFAHPRGAVFLEAAFDAVGALVAAVRAALCGPADGEAAYQLAYHAGCAMEVLSCMAACPLFYQRLMIHDPHGAAPLRLALACLALHDAPLAAPPFRRVVAPGAPPSARPVLAATRPPYLTHKGGGAAELLAARGFALLLLLGEYPEPSYLDQLFAGAATKALAEQLVGRSAGYMGQVLLRPVASAFPPGAGEGQMAANVLRAAELLSDDSNFRAALIPGLAPTLAQLLQHRDPALFASMWCAGADAVALHSSDVEVLVNSATPAALAGVAAYAAAAKAHFAVGVPAKGGGGGGGAGARVPGQHSEAARIGRQLALERAVLLTKLLVNLHFHSDALEPALKVRARKEGGQVGGAGASPRGVRLWMDGWTVFPPCSPRLAAPNERHLHPLLPVRPPACRTPSSTRCWRR
jgi:hypothetical protein